jgi:hypothetical protein
VKLRTTRFPEVSAVIAYLTDLALGRWRRMDPTVADFSPGHASSDVQLRSRAGSQVSLGKVLKFESVEVRSLHPHSLTSAPHTLALASLFSLQLEAS